MDQSYKAHLFVCTNKKEGKPCCADKGAEDFRKTLKEMAREKWGKQVRINASGCLDRCSEGISAVLYPQGRWFVQLKNTKEDMQTLMEAVEEAVTMEEKP